MSSERPTDVQSICKKALSILSIPEREEYLNEVCRNNAELRQQVDDCIDSQNVRLADKVLENLFGADENYSKHLRINQKGNKSGRLIGTGKKFELVELIGRGGMGEVYRAIDRSMEGRPIAIKLISDHLMGEKENLERFRREAGAAGKLDHDNICTIHEFGVDNGQLFFVMPFYKGITLKEKILRTRLPIEKVIDYTIQIARGLKHAHQNNIIHRDIKPANLFIKASEPTETVIILDFGVAKLLDANTDLTQSRPIGTRPYMSPELLNGDVSPMCDMWALGVVLYEMITGEKPFTGEGDNLKNAILFNPPLPLTKYRNDVPKELQILVGKLLNKDINKRYSTIDDLIHAISPQNSDQPKTISIVLDREFEKYSNEELHSLLRAISELSQNKRVQVELIDVRPGSVQIILRLPASLADRVIEEVQKGTFHRFGVINAGEIQPELLNSPIPIQGIQDVHQQYQLLNELIQEMEFAGSQSERGQLTPEIPGYISPGQEAQLSKKSVPSRNIHSLRGIGSNKILYEDRLQNPIFNALQIAQLDLQRGMFGGGTVILGGPTIPLPPEMLRRGNIRVIPFNKNQFFTGRKTQLESIAHSLQNTHKVILHGMWGVGKTQIALEYLYRHSSEYTHILWVNAESRASIASGYREIAETIGLSQRGEVNQDFIIGAITRWLDSNKNWLLVFDGADKPEEFKHSNDQKSILPDSDNGHILVTSRAPFGQWSVLGSASHIKIQDMSKDDALAFLKDRTGRDLATSDERNAASQLAKALGYLPLALEHAAVYIREEEYSFSRYFKTFQSLGVKLLEKGLVDKDEERRTVTHTCLLNFGQVEKKSSAAGDVLRICSLLAQAPIPVRLFTDGASALGNNISRALLGVEDDPTLINELLSPLKRFSFIQHERESDNLMIHRLNQEVILNEQVVFQTTIWLERIVSALNLTLPADDDYENWNHIWQPLDVHNEQISQRILDEDLQSTSTGQYLDLVARYFSLRSRIKDALPLQEKALEIRQNVLGAEHPDTASSYSNLAVLNTKQGTYEKAEELHREALRIRENRLGREHQDTAKSYNELAELYYILGRYKDAEPLYENALEIQKHVLGEVHADTATTFNNLAVLYFTAGLYDKSERFLNQALDIRKELFGEEHPDVASSMGILSLIYILQDRYDDADRITTTTLEIRQNIFGEDHLATANAYDSKGYLYYMLNQYDKAEPLYQKALAIREKILGEEHPDTATSYDSLANYYYSIGNYEEAESRHEKALQIRKLTLAPDHPDIATSYENLANYGYITGKRYEEAEVLFEDALQIRIEKLGKDHLSTATSYESLASYYHFLRLQYDKAEPLYEKALQIRRANLGEDSLFIAPSYSMLAGLYTAQGKYEEAESYYRKALDIQKNILGDDHHITAVSYSDLANLFYGMGQYQEALPFFEKALRIRKAHLEETHLDIAKSYDNLGNYYFTMDENDKAEDYYQKALHIRVQKVGEEHQITAISYSLIAGLYAKQEQVEDAERLYKRALEIRKKTLGNSHPSAINTYTSLANFYYKIGRIQEADSLYKTIQDHPLTATNLSQRGDFYLSQDRIDDAKFFYEKALSIRERILGKEHADTISAYENLAELLIALEQYKEAEQLYLKALSARKQQLGESHIEIAVNYELLANLCMIEQRYDEAEAFLIDSRRIQESLQDTEDHRLASTLNQLANIYMNTNRFEKAEQLYQQIIEIGETLFEKDHVFLVVNYSNLGQAKLYLNQIDEAAALFEKVYQIQREHHGEENSFAALTKVYIAYSYLKMERYDEVEELILEALEFQEKNLGEKHQDTLFSYQVLLELYQAQNRFHEQLGVLFKLNLSGVPQLDSPTLAEKDFNVVTFDDKMSHKSHSSEFKFTFDELQVEENREENLISLSMNTHIWESDNNRIKDLVQLTTRVTFNHSEFPLGGEPSSDHEALLPVYLGVLISKTRRELYNRTRERVDDAMLLPLVERDIVWDHLQQNASYTGAFATIESDSDLSTFSHGRLFAETPSDWEDRSTLIFVSPPQELAEENESENDKPNLYHNNININFEPIPNDVTSPEEYLTSISESLEEAGILAEDLEINPLMFGSSQGSYVYRRLQMGELWVRQLTAVNFTDDRMLVVTTSTAEGAHEVMIPILKGFIESIRIGEPVLQEYNGDYQGEVVTVRHGDFSMTVPADWVDRSSLVLISPPQKLRLNAESTHDISEYHNNLNINFEPQPEDIHSPDDYLRSVSQSLLEAGVEFEELDVIPIQMGGIKGSCVYRRLRFGETWVRQLTAIAFMHGLMIIATTSTAEGDHAHNIPHLLSILRSVRFE